MPVVLVAVPMLVRLAVRSSSGLLIPSMRAAATAVPGQFTRAG
jgi:hypothetical protein